MTEIDADGAIKAARQQLEDAASHLEWILTRACPRPPDHDYIRTDNGNPPWCPICNRTIYGERIQP